MNKLITGAALLLAMGHAQAGLINPQFDPSLTGWTVEGDASRVVPSGGGTDGQLFVTSADIGEAEHSGSGNSALNNGAQLTGLETTLFGSSSGQLAALSTATSITDVSVVYNDISVDTSGTLSWDWRMLTDEEEAFGGAVPRQDDVGFIGLIATGASNFTHVVSLNAASLSWGAGGSGLAANYSFQTASGLQSDNIAGIADGTYRLVIGVFDAGTAGDANSAVLLDNLALADGAPAPIPGTVALLGLGLIGLLRKK